MVKTYDCTNGGAQWCQGCYTMTEDKDGYGDWVRKEDYDALAAELAKLKEQRREIVAGAAERVQALEAALRWAVEYLTDRDMEGMLQLEEEQAGLIACHAALAASETPEAMRSRVVTETADAIAEQRGLTAETPEAMRSRVVTETADAIAEQRGLTAETKAQPGIGPLEPAPQDYKVQCRCGWMGNVSALKSLPEFKMGCPDCSAEFVPIGKMTFPVKAETDCNCGWTNGSHDVDCISLGLPPKIEAQQP